jgi:hypothetical protein
MPVQCFTSRHTAFLLTTNLADFHARFGTALLLLSSSDCRRACYIVADPMAAMAVAVVVVAVRPIWTNIRSLSSAGGWHTCLRGFRFQSSLALYIAYAIIHGCTAFTYAKVCFNLNSGVQNLRLAVFNLIIATQARHDSSRHEDGCGCLFKYMPVSWFPSDMNRFYFIYFWLLAGLQFVCSAAERGSDTAQKNHDV